jgi:hypothetical protein
MSTPTPVWYPLPPNPRPRMPQPVATQPITYLTSDRPVDRSTIGSGPIPNPSYLPPVVAAEKSRWRVAWDALWAAKVAGGTTPVAPVTPGTTTPGLLSRIGTWVWDGLKSVVTPERIIIGLLAFSLWGPTIESDSSSVWSTIFPNKATKAGRSCRKDLGSSAAVGAHALASAIRSGATVEAADVVFQTKFQTARNAAFSKNYAPMFAAVVPPGTEPTTVAEKKAAADQREKYAQLWDDFGDGLVRRNLFLGW